MLEVFAIFIVILRRIYFVLKRLNLNFIYFLKRVIIQSDKLVTDSYYSPFLAGFQAYWFAI